MAGYDLVLLLGQSNNKSPATQDTGDDDYSNIPNTYQFADTTQSIVAATHPLDAPGAGPNTLGKWKLFAEQYEANYLAAGRSLLFVPVAYGGAGFTNGTGDLYPGNADYEAAKDTIIAALATHASNRIVFVSFWHGEADAIAGTSTYYTDLSYYWSEMKTDISALNDSIPFALLQPAARDESGYANVVAGLKQFADESQNRIYIDLSDGVYDVSEHYDRNTVLDADQQEYDFYVWATTMSGNATVKQKSIIGYNDGAFDASGEPVNGTAEFFVGYSYAGELLSESLDLVLMNADGTTEDLCIVGYGDRDLKNDVPYIIIDTDRSALIADNTTNDWPDSVSLVFKVDGATTRTLSATDMQAATKSQLTAPTHRPNFVSFSPSSGTELGCLTAIDTNGEGGTVTTTNASGTNLIDSASVWTDDEHNGKAVYNITTGAISVIVDTIDSTNTLDLAGMVRGSTVANTSGDVYRVGSMIELEVTWAASSGGGSTRIIDHNIIG